MRVDVVRRSEKAGNLRRGRASERVNGRVEAEENGQRALPRWGYRVSALLRAVFFSDLRALLFWSGL